MSQQPPQEDTFTASWLSRSRRLGTLSPDILDLIEARYAGDRLDEAGLLQDLANLPDPPEVRDAHDAD